MFVIFSHIFGVLFSPSSILVFLALIAVAALFTRYARAARYLLVGVMGVFVMCSFGPIGAILVRPLEDRFPLPSASIPAPVGLIVLGGALRPDITTARGTAVLAGSGGRLTAAAILARRYPSARVVFSGGPGDPSGLDRDEAHAAQRFLTSLGIEVERIALENRSLNTDQNANLTREFVHPQSGQVWLLITSAAHMPRAIGAFRHAGFNVIAYPTDYLTLGQPSDYWSVVGDPAGGLGMVNSAMHEWFGLIGYRLAGKIDALLPGP